MTLPRFAFEEDEDDATGPAQFVLKLPPSYVRKLERLNAQPLFPTTPSVPWTIETPATATAPAPSFWKLVAVLASAAAIVVLGLGVGSAAAQPGVSAVGISKRAPKSLETHVRTSARQTGVVTVSVESLKRSHVRRRR